MPTYSRPEAIDELFAASSQLDELRQASKIARDNLHRDVYQIILREDHERQLSQVDNSEILKLPLEERRARFEHAVSAKLGHPWDQLAHKISISREDFVNKNGVEDPGYYRRKRFKYQTEARMDEYPSDKFYFNVRCCARTAMNKQSLNEFAMIAEYYGFGVKNKPAAITEDIELRTKKLDEADKVSPYYGTKVERSFCADPTIGHISFKLPDDSVYRYSQNEQGQKLFYDPAGLWLCSDSKEFMTPELFGQQKHTWILYRPSKKYAEVENPVGQIKVFSIQADMQNETLKQVFEDGTEKELSIDGLKVKKP